MNERSNEELERIVLKEKVGEIEKENKRKKRDKIIKKYVCLVPPLCSLI